MLISLNLKRADMKWEPMKTMSWRCDANGRCARTLVTACLIAILTSAVSLGDDRAAYAAGETIFLPLVIKDTIIRRLPEVTVSHQHGVVNEAFFLELSVRAPKATIHFTLDGSAPGPGLGEVYDGPLWIDHTTVIRAAASLQGYLPSPILTSTYIFIGDTLVQPGAPPEFPMFWGTYPEGRLLGRPVLADYAMDTRITLYDPRYASSVRDDLMSIPSLSIVMDRDDLFGVAPGIRGIYSHPLDKGSRVDPETGEVSRPWERKASAEWLRPDGGQGFQIDAGIRIAGGWSRKPDGMAKHSFSLRFRREYGAGRLRYPLFEREGPDRFDALRLRAGQADTFHYFAGKAQYINDEWGRQTQSDMGWEAARGTWAHLYLNGLYWGLYNVTEELDDAFAADHMGGDEPDWDVIEADVDPSNVEGWKVNDGDDAAFRELMSIKDISARSGEIDRLTYELTSSFVDLTQYIDYTLIELYGDNWDWPHNNWTAMRSRVLDDGFRFFVWDYEQVLPLRKKGEVCGPCSKNSGVETCGTRRCGQSVVTDGAAGLHGWLLASSEYRLEFADRARRHLLEDGALAPSAAAGRYASIADRVERSIVGESARWGDVAFGERTKSENWFFISPFRDITITLDDHWRPERDRLLREFYPERSKEMLQQLCAAGLYPPVSSPRITVKTEGPRISYRLRYHARSPGRWMCRASQRWDDLVYDRWEGPASGVVGRAPLARRPSVSRRPPIHGAIRCAGPGASPISRRDFKHRTVYGAPRRR